MTVVGVDRAKSHIMWDGPRAWRRGLHGAFPPRRVARGELDNAALSAPMGQATLPGSRQPEPAARHSAHRRTRPQHHGRPYHRQPRPYRLWHRRSAWGGFPAGLVHTACLCVPADGLPVVYEDRGPGGLYVIHESRRPARYLPQLARDMEEEEPDDLAMLANHDVASVIVLVNDLVTRRAADAAEWSTDRRYIDILNGRGTGALLRQPWIAHPDALLDHPADEYRVVLADWLARRRADPGHFLDHSSALQAFAFPDHMPMPAAEEVQDMLNQQMAPWKFLRRDAVRAGRAIVDWVRPATVALDRSHTLLVTGVYLDDSDGDDDDEGPKQEARGMAKGQTAAKNQPGMPIRRSPRLAALLREPSPK